MCVAITTGAMVVAGSAPAGDRTRLRLDIAAEIWSTTALHAAPTPDRPAFPSGGQAGQYGRTEEAQRQLAEQLGAMRGLYGVISSKAAAHTSRQGSFPWWSPIGLTTEVKSGNLSDRDCRPHLDRGSTRFAVSVDRGAIVETFPLSNAICVRGDRCNAGVRTDATRSSRRDKLRYRSKSRVGARLAARFTMYLPLGHNGTPIRICGQDKADRPRCRNNQRGPVILGRVRPDNACRPKYLER